MKTKNNPFKITQETPRHITKLWEQDFDEIKEVLEKMIEDFKPKEKKH